jgi:hypothetical protein
MIVRHRIFEKYDNYRFNIPYKAGDKVLIKTGDRVKSGTELIHKKGSSIKQSFFIPEQIDVELSKIQNFLNCIDGEFVNKGDVLAEKVVGGGLNVKKLISPAQGVVDLSRIESGYLDLLGEEKEILVKSNFKGIIEGVNPVEGIEIFSTAYALDLLSISDFRLKGDKARNLVGEFVILSEGKDLLLRATESNYEDKIVFVGKYLHTELLHDLFEKGALFVLTYSMEYEDFRKQGLPVGVIGGFGEIYSSKTILDLIYSMNGKFAVVDYEESQIFFITDDTSYNVKEDVFVKFAPGSLVLSRSLSNYGMLGKILNMEGDMYATVEWEGGQRSIINIGSLEFVSL